MKTNLKALTLILSFVFHSSAFAWIAKDATQKEYQFKFKLSGQTLEIKSQAGSYEEAYRQAAKQCFNHYKNGQNLDEQRGLDIIDVCANPRS